MSLWKQNFKGTRLEAGLGVMIYYNNVRYPSRCNPKETEKTERMDRWKEARGGKIQSRYSLDLKAIKYTEEHFEV